MFSTVIRVATTAMIQVKQLQPCEHTSLINFAEVVQSNVCPLETDSYWNITWKPTLAGMIDTQKCPGGAHATG